MVLERLKNAELGGTLCVRSLYMGLCVSVAKFGLALSLLPISKSSTGSNSNSAAAIAENAMLVATSGQGELDVPTMKKYIQYCKAKCKPRLSDEAGDILASSYVKIRDDVRKRCMEVS